MHYPDWLDRDEYPFAPHVLELEAGRMHYVDEGQGPVIVMVHGTPTWSFLYRNLIKGLAQDYRCIAMDHLGFGLSDKPAGWSYRAVNHARNVAALIEHLGLRDITLVVHDFGGSIGLAYALDHPKNVARLVLFNTWMWPFTDPTAVRAGTFFGGPIGKVLYTWFNFSPRVIVRAAWGDRAKLTPALHRHYTAVHQTLQDRYGMWVFAREVLQAGSWWESLWARRERIKNLPALLLWGMKDPAIKAENLARWQSLFSQAETVTFPNAGHFVQEEEWQDIVPHIAQFMNRHLVAV
jgi:haloalkane dehalogenase